MEDSAIQFSCGGHEEAATSTTAPNETSSFHTALEEFHLSSSDEVALGDRSSAVSSTEQKSEYFSSRVEEMMHSKSQFSSDVERDIEHSRVHWSELSGSPNLSEDKEDGKDGEDLDVENTKVYTELADDPNFGEFFLAWVPVKWKLGRKIAEGGQAEIFEVLDGDTVHAELLFKVFKKGARISDLRKLWPDGVLRHDVPCVVGFGLTVDDGRFAFGMRKCWGDLRKLIDQAKQEKKNQGPPFPYEWNGHTLLARSTMTRIAITMKNLHEKGIFHRDLKASNILIRIEGEVLRIIVADFECSIGVVGTGFFRAPEILLDLKTKKKNRALDFSKEMDVYSYGMTCFEVATGLLPFEGELEACRASYDLVIEGWRPKLPSDLDVTLKDLIERCWNPIPNERPSFSEIVEILESS